MTKLKSTQKECAICHRLFQYKSSKKKFCSTSCRNVQYRQRYPERVKTQQLAWQRANRDKIKEYLSVPTHRIAANLRSRLSKAIGRKQKTVSMGEYLGCSLDELKLYLESKFQPGMSWENYGQWHIDHVKPLTIFDLTDPQQVKTACHYTNLQPLWAIDNRKKSDKHD